MVADDPDEGAGGEVGELEALGAQVQGQPPGQAEADRPALAVDDDGGAAGEGDHAGQVAGGAAGAG